MIGVIAFRLSVFGYPLPNTYYAKTRYDTNGFPELVKMMLWLAPPSLGVLSGTVFAILKRGSRPELAVSCALFLVQAAISSSVDPVMNFLIRYLVPFLPFMILPALRALSWIRQPYLHHVSVAAILIALLLPLAGIRSRAAQSDAIVAAQGAVVKWFDAAPDSTVVSISDLGRIPYYTHLTFNDTWGLVDRDIGHKGFNGTYEFLHMPDFFLLVGYMDSLGIHLKFWREEKILSQELFDDSYEPAGIGMPPGASVDSAGCYYFIFRRRPGAVALVKSFGKEYWGRKMEITRTPK